MNGTAYKLRTRKGVGIIYVIRYVYKHDHIYLHSNKHNIQGKTVKVRVYILNMVRNREKITVQISEKWDSKIVSKAFKIPRWLYICV